MAARKPKVDEVIDGVRVRVYATRSEFEAIYGDADIADPNANVRVYPKVGTPDAWTRQARLDYDPAEDA